MTLGYDSANNTQAAFPNQPVNQNRFAISDDAFDVTVSKNNNPMVGSLLHHLMEITRHRDHNLLGIAVVTALQDLLGATQARILELFEYRGELYVRPTVMINGGKAEAILDNSEIELTGDLISRYPALAACVQQQQRHAEERTSDGSYRLWLPVWIKEKTNSCIEITSKLAYAGATQQVAEGIISVYRNFQSLLDYSERDSLTGLLNRKTFDENFSRMVSLQTHSGSKIPLSEPDRRSMSDHKGQWLAVVDIDHFKRVNDEFGHLYGDEVLLMIANMLQASFRSHDRIFRFGGEEFVVLLRSATLEDARQIFSRFRAAVETHDFPQVGNITVSLGFASISYETPVVILGHADQALYYAKEHGRNQVCHYDELLERGELRPVSSNDSVEFF